MLQTGQQYSKTERINALKIVRRWLVGTSARLRTRMICSRFDPLETIPSTCKFHLRLSCSMRPSTLCELIFSSSTSFICSISLDGLLRKNEMVMSLHFFGCSFILLREAHRFIWSRPDWVFETSFALTTSEKVRSSTNFQYEKGDSSFRSLIMMRNKIGPSLVP